ncbi:hypothetical protein A2767_06005 [Candidatus Roizmanbacteria bacterium RIFCSPHIGHO2_01_FULL_35_10]|uniref:Transposase IS200-like domain-containing protein n=1 Tax=Candidatus Roizmanbacteria bacterium RIFCSPLOWO2_01_FULL_35_13 TaxID=1802055 RepID=A0A1F7IHY2_9BACT|nr:MAG: hypothetical protein A2767_06005 [Candidatus Roizmanbacteria bacterium RIFCSPHIGHO2_01_FULL_35_10]OGK42958.1 MAG: hypothetical protein A3A74_05825 [Candidatus Roizmanbacteria bacterium RIFCSPLOWO2_01_FULL_35_13]
MASHKIVLATNETYHLFNRSIGKVDIFSNLDNLNKILEVVNYYRYPQRIKLSRYNSMLESQKSEYLSTIIKNPPLIDIYVFSFMPNHFHLLAKQLQDKGITIFLSNIQNSFAKYFDLKNDRNGGLFQRSFKAKRITNNGEFIHVSRYIHINHVTSRIIEFEQLKTYEWTSLPCYLNEKLNKFVNTKPILDYFKTPEKYLKFLENNVDHQRKLKKIKDLLLD